MERPDRTRVRARILRELGDRHGGWRPWQEHPGTGNRIDAVCRECAYQFEHNQRGLD